MDLSSQLNEPTSDQLALTVDSDKLDQNLPGQSNSRYSHGESGQGKIDQSEDNAKEYYRLTNNELRASAISTGISKDMAFISSNEGYNQSSSSNDDATDMIDPNVDSSKKRIVHDSSVAERTEGNLSGDTIHSPRNHIDETICLERYKECEDDQIHKELGSRDIEPISVEGNSLRGIEKRLLHNDEDDTSEDTKCISRRNSISPRAEAIHEGNTSAALDINNDIVHDIDRQEDLNSEVEDISKKEYLDDEGDRACVVPSRALKDAKCALKYSYESDSENRTGNLKNNSRATSPSTIIRPISLRSQSISSIFSDESEASNPLTDQSEDSASLRVKRGINQDEQNGDGSENSYQRNESSKSSSEKDEALKEPSQLTKSQVLTFFSLAISIFLDQVSFSVLAPFFPREATNKGVSSLQVGFIFGAFALVNVIFSPVFGKFLPRLGAKFTVVSGIWIVAGCNILFG